MCCMSVSVGMIRCIFVCTLYMNLCYAFVFVQCACVPMSMNLYLFNMIWSSDVSAAVFSAVTGAEEPVLCMCV